jgi:hypothetical protein
VEKISVMRCGWKTDVLRASSLLVVELLVTTASGGVEVGQLVVW